MDAERLKQIEKIYHAALETAVARRQEFLRETCGADENLRLEVESLLAFDNVFDSFIDSPPDALVAEMFSERERQAIRLNRRIAHYKTKKLLGRGGMGEVYLAEDVNLNRQVALKFLSAELRPAEKIRARSADGFRVKSSEYSHRSQIRRGKRQSFYRHGICQRRDFKRENSGRTIAGQRDSSRRRTNRGGAQSGNRSPRHQTGQRDDSPRRNRQSA